MNKYQVALDRRKEEFENMFNVLDMEKNNEFYKDIELLQELVDRVTPKKPRYEHAPKPSKAYKYECPVCGCFQALNCKATEVLYCYECGQALDWNDEK